MSLDVANIELETTIKLPPSVDQAFLPAENQLDLFPHSPGTGD